MEIKRVGVVGCGLMGSGITQVCAQAGYQVTVSEINQELLKKGLGSLDGRLAKSVADGKMSAPDKAAVLGRITGTTDTKDFRGCDLVIEAAVENMDLKKKIFAELDGICPAHAILASNTSGLSIIGMASATKRPEKVLGTHFFNPVPVMKLVEVVRSIATSDETLESVKAFVKSLGKTHIVAKDTPGFIVNRLTSALMLTAIRLLESGAATREDIDTAATLGLNHPMGPLALLDLVGIDTVYHNNLVVYDELNDPLYAPPPLMRSMVAAGWLGRKTGKGFYDYKSNK
ncbi:MAG: 3-hydroxybutyryl-CoA dehydrogenase [Chloroflexota bacterium]